MRRGLVVVALTAVAGVVSCGDETGDVCQRAAAKVRECPAPDWLQPGAFHPLPPPRSRAECPDDPFARCMAHCYLGARSCDELWSTCRHPDPNAPYVRTWFCDCQLRCASDFLEPAQNT